ncbi:MAG: DUF1697 domain-containing protein [Planctomycetes bacterium]|nr:DUF1697 domain-containing protein [Planctomycetota bacterium]
MSGAVRKSGTAERHVALLRGINVGGKNKLLMADLVELFEAAGCTAVKTYIQSGNVVFAASPKVAAVLAGRIPERIEEEFGLRVPIVLRSAAEFGTTVRSNPFLELGADPDALHVAFLREKPDKAHVAALDPGRSPGDSFQLRGRELFLHLPNGVARTKLSSAYLDKTLGTVCTARNWRTVQKIHELVAP